jgi:alpha-glucoside transport system permease protein
VDDGERGLPGVPVRLERASEVVGRTTTDQSGGFSFGSLTPGEYHIVLEEAAFRPPFEGLAWLGPGLITGALIASYIWINTGFALIIIGAGLAGINRDYLDSARVEGANELQVLLRVTIPLLRQALMVVIVTVSISVLKIFDLIIVIAPESVQSHATVLALEMWRSSFGGARDFGLGSAIAIVLFVLIVPAMVLNIRRFRLED